MHTKLNYDYELTILVLFYKKSIRTGSASLTWPNKLVQPVPCTFQIHSIGGSMSN